MNFCGFAVARKVLFLVLSEAMHQQGTMMFLVAAFQGIVFEKIQLKKKKNVGTESQNKIAHFSPDSGRYR